MAGYPGTIAATWQRAGRAGRRQASRRRCWWRSSAPLDQFIVRHPVVFLRSLAGTRAHRSRQPAHSRRPREVRGVRAAVHGATEQFGRYDVQEMLGDPRRAGAGPSVGRAPRPTPASDDAPGPGPASRIRPTRSVSGRCRRTTSSSSTRPTRPASSAKPISPAARPRSIPRPSTSSKAKLYQVEKFDFDGRKAFVREIDCDYYTDAMSHTRVTILDTFAERASSDEPVRVSRPHGEGAAWRRTGRRRFKKIKFYTNENVGSGDLDLPEQQMHTTSYWLTIPAAVMGMLPYAADDRRDGLSGLAFALRPDRAAAADVRSPRHRHLDRYRRSRSLRRATLPVRARGDHSPGCSSTTTIPAASDSASRSSACTASCSTTPAG